MALQAFLLLIGLTGLWFSSERIVKAAKAIADRLGVTPLVVGLTIVSIGTSLPEIMVTTFSGVRGADDLAVSAMIGSCLSQITVILGVAALVENIKVRPKALYIDGTMMMMAILLFTLFLATGLQLTALEGFLLVVIYGAYLWFTVKHDDLRAEAKEKGKHRKRGLPFGLRLVEIAVAIAVLIYSADLVLESALSMAGANGFSESFVGVTLIGFATGLPELSTAIVAAIRKEPGISVGTLIGSNVTDPLLSLGLGAMVGGGFALDPALLLFDIPFWFIVSIIALLMLRSDSLTLNRYEGASLILIYILFVMSKFAMLG
jgi:cation:H+ antiporter